ncbi:hypothetical protein GYMLUDRAFT_248238 [Collybiopsis luxurians FD-317 M1]|uniref:Uncharacterized protein n=1 Tax=Collybiopsis luxurians FD-317 M1 TaxID=944289 RepID=A0A0D0BME8_9AGAR|nr:hypothetical protein GYMLUDRAFT_248238 [Collybiopsis luxurians FD-317 M1]
MPFDKTQTHSIGDILQAFQVNVSIRDLLHVALGCQLFNVDDDSDIELPEELAGDVYSQSHALPPLPNMHQANATEETLSIPAPHPPHLPPHGTSYAPPPPPPSLK